ncbi:hypothetical protein [Streptomyces sp. NBC_00059]|uniref:hypothetical protein n=1 Tax=Streptomyces sp. NBC_00059 TaxID=2975635 RepID=UPI002255E1C1|nr:hypothetical protein [Streptomyces sp. NBC_00059]MCX5410476.1 hypothetical protein [Streptomyces sp. NBC_00059]
MERLIPLILLGLAVFFWLRARRKTAAYLASYESPAAGVREGDERRDPPAPAA